MSEKLTEKQEAFCREYLIDFNGTQAAIRAGYSEATAGVIASENLKKPNVASRMKELIAERSKRTEITADYVLSTIKETVERCLQREPVYEFIDGEKVPTGEWKFEHSGALRGAELLGKHLKLFTDKIEHSGKVTLEELVSASTEGSDQ